MTQQRRGKNIAIAGSFFQLVFSAVMLVIWLLTNSAAAMACLWLLAGGIGVWLMAALLFYCRELERREALEMEQIAAGGAAGGTIFEGDVEQEMRIAARRRALVERWVVPVFTVVWAGYHVALGVLMLRYLGRTGPRPIESAGEGALFVVLIGFLAFLFSFYSLGMGRRAQWRVLRAAGSYLLINVLLMAALAAALLGAWQDYPGADRVVAYIIPIVQLVLAAELLLNFVLDLYRPRVPGQEERFSFDSRILALIADPQRVGTSIAEAINYQFGFEVSSSWFYRLVSRAVGPLLVFGLLVLVAMSSIVTVREGEEYVVQRWGRAAPDRETLKAGFRLKWPWPIETATRFNVGQVHEILLGAGGPQSEENRQAAIIKGREYFLWTQEHGRYKELDFLVAVPREEGSGRGPEPKRAKTPDTSPGGGEGPAAVVKGIEKVPAVNIIKLVVSVQYVIGNVYDYGFGHTDTKKVLEDVAYREMTSYCASATLDTKEEGGPSGRPQAIMTSGRAELAQALKRRIQHVADELKLGVKIVYVGLPAVHPPADAAPAYEEVFAAERRMVQRRYEAEAQANRVLAAIAGDPGMALRLALRISALGDFNRLQTIRPRPQEFLTELQERIGIRREEIAKLDQQIQEERLLGQAAEDEDTVARELRDLYASHVELLQAVLAESTKSGPPDLGARITEAQRLADGLLRLVAGEAAALVETARADRWQKELETRVLESSFLRHLDPYQARPDVYMLNLWMDLWDEVLPGAPKVVLGVDRDRVEFRLNWEQEESVVGAQTMQPDDARFGQ
ncbi:MAG TPA: SPFH domain-containing protein [Phycisphaerae bacterium]|nr:SPFH domain-containing protein [Phycisphaerae bacterium]